MQGVWSTYQKLRDIIDLEIVQWGNTLGDGTLQVPCPQPSPSSSPNSSPNPIPIPSPSPNPSQNTTCQHGAVECRVQRVYACNKYRTQCAAAR